MFPICSRYTISPDRVESGMADKIPAKSRLLFKDKLP